METRLTVLEVPAVGLKTGVLWRRGWDGPGESVDQVLALVHQSLVAELDELLLELRLLEVDLLCRQTLGTRSLCNGRTLRLRSA